MLTGETPSQIDRIWDAFWSGGISNPLEVIEQITYLLLLKHLYELETAEELKANWEKKSMQKRFFPEGNDNKKCPYQDFRWTASRTSIRATCTPSSASMFPLAANSRWQRAPPTLGRL
jgi:hypothetical protein